MPDIHLEIEKKYDAAVNDAVPELTGVAGVEAVEHLPAEELVAVYFDTPDLRLTAGAVTLRRRAGGRDDGWHLKLPLATGRRLEVRRDAGRSASRPPKALLDLVRAHVGTAELVPVATLRTTRQVTLLHGPAEPVAEVADDTVHAVRHLDGEESTWREIEVELVTGGPEQLAELDRALRGAGLAPATSDSKAGRVLNPAGSADRPERRLRRRSSTEDVVAARIGALLRELQSVDPLVRTRVADAVPEFARVLQALRGLLAAFRRHLAAEELAAVEETLGSVAAAATVAGLLPAAEEDLRKGFDAEPADLAPGGVRRLAVARLRASRRAATTELIRGLGHPGYAALLDHLSAWAEAPPVGSGAGRAGDVLPEVVEREVRRLRRRVRRLEAADPESWDRVDDAVLRVSAAVDAGRPVLGQPLAALTATVADLHRQVSAAARARVLQQQLLDLARQDPGPGAGAFTLGRLHARQDREVRRARRDLRRAARQLGQEAQTLR